MPTNVDLIIQIVSDQRPSGVDGASNYDRAHFLYEVFECEELDLDGHYDFSNINACKDLDRVEGCKHLALLQMQYVKEMVDFELMDPEEGDIILNYLTLSVQRINWHHHHLAMGRITPPFPGLN